ncbi:hypothetical protein FN846DRAFT_404093 [Sphaerosporella brunnea]|uniref:Cupredoxin n=1 Tax=Sphaerosporella brunnea TaxID=1250544 RepID=A0A5J5F4Z9_9PEZI|nr:hypothetical protein FN846DRAFT_404093 [Sphaerosporella brunnea]
MHFSRKALTSAATALLFSTATAQQLNITVPSGQVMTHVIQVSDANGTLAFFPSELTANKGDLLQFQFWPKAHSVAQSSFASPCQPLDSAGTTGFWSGFMPVTPQDTTMPVFSVVVNDTKPIWAYCATGKHCQAGMALVVNPPVGKTLAMYQAAAKSVEVTGIPSTVEGGTATNGTAAGPAPSGGLGSGDVAAGGNTTVPAGSSAVMPSTQPSSTGATAGAAGLKVTTGKAMVALVAAFVGFVCVV